ncbi:dimethylsulfonioproprionate lyase family protein [Lichenifustis flavocetrariae]|uniref:Dimethylsulfonioproprionate lyase family protein n=1 Tax=Lichenifustis flavocetrariae TaxID=2949735 RepID=A0AA41YZZ3_9HYPH|nr:dimethylsulfonioproprionate lyase family protein [Lichenifustis flavocetrariae]MCW6511676.1 dimethylsulfonioproprionate lyase family protein [Lichenifustis flavocetrariae]
MDPTDTEGQVALRLAKAAYALLEPIAAAQPFVAHWPETIVLRSTPPETLPALRWLDGASAFSHPTTSRLMAMLAETAAELAWRQSYAAADFGPSFLERYGWTELVGPSGPIGSKRMTCGFLLLGPDLHYPPHAHEAEELYLPLAGTALWQRGNGAPSLVPPGTPIYHESWLPHAMWTRTEPLVALYCWRGGTLGAKPQIMSRAL